MTKFKKQRQNYAGGWKPEVLLHGPDKRLQDIMERRRHAVIQEWKNNPNNLVIHSPLKDFTNHLNSQIPYFPACGGVEIGEITPLEGFSFENVVVITHKTAPSDFSPSLWVRSSYRDHLSAFQRFIKVYYGELAHRLNMIGYDVDHLFNKKRAARDTFLRLEATPSFSNQSWGSRFERYSSKRRHIETSGKIKGVADWTVIAKLSGVDGPEKIDGNPEVGTLGRYIEYQNVDSFPDFAKEVVVDLFNRTYDR